MVNFQEKAAATKEIQKSVRDLLSLEITLPLGNPNLKLVHTNQCLFTELPSNVFELANMGVIGKAMNSEYSRFSGYQLNRWYIEGVDIKRKSDGTGTMTLKLNPFASTLLDFKDNKTEMRKAYSDAMNKNTNSTSSSKSTNKTVKSTKAKKISISQALKEVGKLMEKKKYVRHTYSDYKNFVKHGYGDCWAGSYFIACQLQKRGVTAKIVTYGTGMSAVHRSVLYKDDNGNWKDFPYRNFKIDSRFRNTGASKHGKKIPNNCPKNI